MKVMKVKWILIMVSVTLAIALVASAFTGVAKAQSDFPGGTYTQDFDSLASSGTSSTLPTGWAFSETDSNANSIYTAGTGSSNIGDTYSFGTSGSTERALGELSSGTLMSTFGAQFKNTTGSTIGKLLIQYYCEQWRIGDTAAVIDVLNFQYSTDATSLSTGTWVDFDGLDCTSTDTTGTVGAQDGNTLRIQVSDTITGLGVASDTTFWIRWVATDISGSDDGLAVDVFSMSAQTPTAITLRGLSASSGGTTLPVMGLALAGLLVGAVVVRRK